MRDADPVVLRRMLALRRFGLLRGVELDELASLAENVVELVLPAGTAVAPREAPRAVATFVLEGRITARRRSWGPGDVHGALELLAGRPLDEPAVVEHGLRALQLASGDLQDVLEDNFGVLLSVIRELAAHVAAAHLLRTPDGPPPDAAHPLGLVDQLRLLRLQPPLAHARVGVLAALAARSQELEVGAGEIVVRAGEVATRALVIVDGTLVPRGGGAARGRGAAVGLVETIAGAPHATTLEAATPARLLASSGAALVDVLEDRPDAGLGMIAAFAGALLDGPHARAAS